MQPFSINIFIHGCTYRPCTPVPGYGYVIPVTASLPCTLPPLCAQNAVLLAGMDIAEFS